MADPPTQQQLQQQQTAHNRTVLLELTAALAQTTGGYVTILAIRLILSRLRPHPSQHVLNWLAYLATSSAIPEFNSGLTEKGPAQRAEEKQAPGWRALYLVAAAERLQVAEEGDEHFGQGSERERTARQAEEHYFELHVMAEERRLRSAALVDSAATLLSDRQGGHEILLGWRSIVDANTTPECRFAHGSNFDATKMPVIGWPGAVHLRCRCTAGPPVPGAPLIPSL